MPEKPKRKQFRRSISVTGEVYDKLKAYCDAHDRSVSGLVEQLLHDVSNAPSK